MDDEAVYGKRFYQLTFKEAIHSSPQIISDYKILTIAVSNSQIQELIQKNKLLSDKKNKIEEDEAQSLAAAIALRQATEKYGIKHAISFHRSIKAAENFTNLNIRLNASKIDKVDISSYHISSKKTAGQRSQLLDDFNNDKLALMTNAKCLTEGVNVPAIDCVLFADPKQSVVDIVQAAGRALRVNEGKKFGYIMMPLIVPDDMELLEFTESTPFKQVARIVTALSTQDERIVEELRLKSEGKKASTGRIEIIGTVPAGFQLDINSFAASIEAKYWERVGRINWMTYEEAKKFIGMFKFASKTFYDNYFKNHKKPSNFPSNPPKVYRLVGWLNWGDFLGTYRIATFERKYLPYDKARNFVHTLRLKNMTEWRDYCLSGKKPDAIPAKPMRTYKDRGWTTLSDWLGTGFIATNGRKYLPFERAHRYTLSLKLKSIEAWKNFKKSNTFPQNIPKAPDIVYGKLGKWVSWGHFLGTNIVATNERKYKTYSQAKKFVHSLKLKSVTEWVNYTKSGNLPIDIPKAPAMVYGKKGMWISWGDWLGTKRKATNKIMFYSFLEAKNLMRIHNIKTTEKYKEFRKTQNKELQLPSLPERTYANKGWISWADFLGKE